jgi:hypothetical protein
MAGLIGLVRGGHFAKEDAYLAAMTQAGEVRLEPDTTKSG